MDALFLLCPHMVEWTGELLEVSLIRTLILFMRVLPHYLITSPKPDFEIPLFFRIRLQHMGFQDIVSQSIAEAFYEPGLAAGHIPSTHMPLVTRQSCDHTQLWGGWEM